MSAFSDSSTIGQIQIDLGAPLQRPARSRRRPRRSGRAARRGYRPAAGPAASRSGATRRDRHRRSSSRCAGSASRSSAAYRRRGPWRSSARRCSTPKRCCSSITDEREVAERDIRLQQRVGPDDDRGQPGGEARQHRVARPPLLAPGQEADLDPGRRREALQYLRGAGAPGSRSAPSAPPGRRSRPRSASPCSATTVLPLPTSPCSSRIMRCGAPCRRRSRPAPWRWLPVSAKPKPGLGLAPASAPVPASTRPRRRRRRARTSATASWLAKISS